MSNFTPEQIQEILDLYFKNFAHHQYIGARYVPIFGRKDESTYEWDNEAPYEPLTIVLHEGNSYTSRQFVPVGVEITNELYWAETGNYNAQIEQYRNEVIDLSGQVSAFGDILPDSQFSETNTVKDYVDTAKNELSGEIDALEDIIPASSFSSASTVKDYIDALKSSTFDQSAYIQKATFFGDSVTYGDLGTIGGQQQGRAAKPYPTVYGEKAGIASIDNQGVNGSTSLTLPDIVDAYSFASTDQVFIAHGSNDWAYSTPIGSPYVQETNKTTFCGCLNYAIQKAIAGNPKCEIILCTPFYAQSSNTEFTNSPGALSENNLGYNIQDYANAVRAVANVNNLKCVNFKESLGINNRNHGTWINDDIHPNQDGYTMMGEWLFRQVSFATSQSSVIALNSYTPNGCNFIGANDFPNNNITPFYPYGDGTQAGQAICLNGTYALSKRYYHFNKDKVYTFHANIRGGSGYTLNVQLNNYDTGNVKVILNRSPHISTVDHEFSVNTVFTVPATGLWRLDFEEMNNHDVYISDIAICEGFAPNPNPSCSLYDHVVWSLNDLNASLRDVTNVTRFRFYVKDGCAHVYGTMSTVANIAVDTKLFSVPKCFAPQLSHFFYGVDSANNNVKFEIMNSGDVYLRTAISANAYFTIDYEWTYRTQTIFSLCDVTSNQA